jgi:hypothetical protein
MGYVFIICGIVAASYSLFALTLLIPGFFMAFTYNGTMIDIDKKKAKTLHCIIWNLHFREMD